VTAAGAALGSLFTLLLSLYLPYRDAGGSFPIEWVVVLVWAFSGFAFWVMGSSIRESMSEAERRKQVLGAS
jgi:hypothetical protein